MLRDPSWLNPNARGRVTVGSEIIRNSDRTVTRHLVIEHRRLCTYVTYVRKIPESHKQIKMHLIPRFNCLFVFAACAFAHLRYLSCRHSPSRASQEKGCYQVGEAVGGQKNTHSKRKYTMEEKKQPSCMYLYRCVWFQYIPMLHMYKLEERLLSRFVALCFTWNMCVSVRILSWHLAITILSGGVVLRFVWHTYIPECFSRNSTSRGRSVFQLKIWNKLEERVLSRGVAWRITSECIVCGWNAT